MSEPVNREAELQERLSAREEKVAGLRGSLSDRRRALLGRLVEGRAGTSPSARPAAIPRRPEPGPAALSFAQERLWFHDRLEPDSSLYNLPAALRLEGRLEVAVLARSLGEIVRRHEALRTVFAAVDGEPRQVVSPAPAPATATIHLPVVDLGGLPPARRESEARRLAAAESQRPFDLARGPLLRAALLRLEESAWLALFNLHHIVGDGWSIGLLVGELAALYRSFLEERSAAAPSPLPELPIQYADFAVWQREWLAGETLAGELAHWRRELQGAPDLLELPSDRLRPQVQTFRGGVLRFTLPGALAAGLAAFAEGEGATLFMALLAGFQALLGRWTGQDDLLVGSAIANRKRPETEPLIGFFVNLLVLRGRLAGGPTARGLLGRTRETALAAFAHQYLPFDRLVEELRPARSRAHNPLVQAALVLQNAPRGALELPGLTLRPLTLPVATAKFDLGLEVTELAGGLACQLEYAADLFDPATAGRLAGHFERLLAAFVEQPESRLPDLPLLTPAERHQLLVEWGGAAAGGVGRAADGEPVWQAVAAQARRRPAAVALELAGGAGADLTYAALDRRARRLAGRLQRLGVGPEVRVGLFAERSLDLAAAILGIWQAGGVFLPLDPGLPDARLALLVEDALAGAGPGGAVLLVQEGLRGRLRDLPVAGVPVMVLEEGEGGGEEVDAALDPAGGGAEDLAYLIYTSGTTGRPKAVAVEHGSLSHTLAATAATFGLRAADRMPCLAPFSFDIFLFELLGPLLAGGTVVLFPLRPTLDVRALAAAVPQCTVLHAVPALMREVVEAVAGSHGGTAPALRLAFVGGDAVAPDLLTDMRRVFPAARVVVLYGPTEGTILASSHEAAGGPDGGRAVRLPIGRPLPGTRLRVHGPGGASAPIGVPGELHIGGRGVARGYLGRPELTAEKFVPLAAAGRREGRWYRTGDLTRFRPDGTLEFLGRIDHQVKVRGFRIELGEIESVLLEQPEVRTAAVVAREQPGTDAPWLVAYLVFGPEAAPLSASELRARLAARLPDYMVPARFVALPALPLTATGKVDRRALPAPSAGAEEGEEAPSRTPPGTPAEELLAGLWAGLLGVEQVGVHDDFFALGGHSLLATRLVSRVREVFGVEVPVRALFDAPTVAGLAALLAAGSGGKPPSPLRPVPRPEPEAGLPLSFAQERLWFLDRLAPGESVYNIPAAVRLTGPLDAAACAAALGEVVRRHEALRTGFREGHDGRPVQVVEPWRPVALPVVDLSALPGGEGGGPVGGAVEDEVRRLAAAEAGRPFDLAAGRPLRTALLRLGAADRDARHVLLLTVHHIAADGWSAGVLVRELAALYGAFRAGRPASAAALPELPVQYGDFAVWQRAWLSGAALEAQLAYWRRALAGAPNLELPTDRPRPAVRSPRGGWQGLALPPALSQDLRRLARGQGATPFMVLLAAFQALLGRLSGQEDLVVGTPLANRMQRGIEGLIGFFVNTLALRADLAGDPGLPALLRRTREATLGAYAHQDLPFEKLVEELAPARDASRTPLFQVMFTLQDALGGIPAAGSLPRFGDLAAELLKTGAAIAKFDFSLALASDGDGGFAGGIEFSADLFDAPTAARLARCFETLLAAAMPDMTEMGAPGGRSLWELPLLAPPERAALLLEWNDTAPDGRPRPVANVAAACEEQARRRPDAVAVAAPDGSLSYGELDRRAGRLARRLRALGVGPEVPVALCAGRSAALIVGMLAVLKAGGAYVPLDPSHPPARLALVLADLAAAGARPVVLVQDGLRDRLPAEPAGSRGVVLSLEGGPGEAAASADDPPPTAAAAGHRAYVIYTSGSTGTPKGVEIEHGALANLISFHLEAFRTVPGDRYTQISNPAFDGAGWEIWGCLAAGATLAVPDEATRAAPERLLAWLAEEAVTVTLQTTALAVAVLARAAEAWPAGWPPGTALRGFQTGGESLHRAPRGLPFQLINLYGPTECTVVATTAVVAGGEGAPPIGRPIAGVRVHLLDRRGELVPPGVPGELVIGGAGVARGYLGLPGRTAESFVPDALGGAPGARLYRTGDLARWRPDGQLEFLGRFDHQVKIRGFRIELGEVEAALASHPGVREAAVVVLGTGGEAATARLVAYAAPREPGALAAADLRAHLATRLPEHMVPVSFVLLPALPLTPNGKVDRQALPAPEPGRHGAGEAAAPRNPAEELLAGVWADLLGVGEVGIHDDFFALGGHSLLATRVVSRVREVFGVELPVRAVFDAPTVAGLGALLAAGSAEAVPPPLRPAPRDGELPLSFAQERLWFLDRLEPGGSAYNIGSAVRLTGPLDVAAFGAALGEVVRRHEALRTGFHEGSEGRPVQVIAPWSPVGLPVIDLSALPGDGEGQEIRRLAAAEAGRPFDLAAGRPLRAALLRAGGAGGDAGHVLLVTVHHIAADGWSVGILVRELAALYGALREGRPASSAGLPELPVQSADFAVWQRGWLSGAVLEAQTAYWRRALAGAPVLELPADRPRPAVLSSRGARRTMALPAGLSEELRRLARGEGATPFMVLLAGFQALLGRLSRQQDVLVGTPIANRTQRGIEGLIGFFVNTLVLRGDLAGGPGFAQLVDRTREATLGAYAHQDLPFEKLVEELAPVRDASRTPLFQVMFTLDEAAPRGEGFADLAAAPLDVEVATAKFDLTLSLGRGGEGGFAGEIEYATDLFEAATVLRLAGQLETLLAAAVGEPGREVGDLPLLGAAERHQLQVEWNEAAGRHLEAGRKRTLLERIAEQAERTPDAVAVVYGEARLTYGELVRRAGRVGRALESGAGGRMGLSLERSPELVVGLLGILAAGGAYVPIDPAYPVERRDFMRGDAGLVAVVGREWLATVAEESVAESVASAAPGRAWAAPQAPGGLTPLQVPGRERVAGRPLYVIYTSGSTGQPKGAVVFEGAFSGLVDWYVDELGLTAADRHLLLSSASFDLTQKNFFAPLLVGAELHLAPSPYDPAELRTLIGRHSITRLNCTPSAFYPLAEEGDPTALASLRTVVLGGEPIALGRLEGWRRSEICRAAVINSYGPTECTDVVAFHRLAPPDGLGPAAVPLGRPIPGVRLWIAAPDREAGLDPAPIGVPGEFWIGGACVGGGYVGDAARTALQFRPDPYPDLPGVRAYRTGDLARRLPSGEIEYLGRIDHQVKVRGFRIELGEIEAALVDQPGVLEAVVVARDLRSDRPGDPQLVAYVVPREMVPTDPGLTTDLRAALARRLPAAMMPSAFVVLAALPLTPSGKVDRRALPAPGEAEGWGEERAGFVAPRTPLEEVLAGIWGELLGISRVGVRDDFFALGGHSLLATQLVSRLRVALGVEVPLRRIFDAPTLERMAAEVAAARQGAPEEAEPPLVPVPRDGGLPLSFAQERLWFLERFDPGNPSLNLPLAVELAGRLSVPALGAALSEIVDRHESLRTTFETVAGEPRQVVHPAGPVALPEVDLAVLPAAAASREAERLAAMQALLGFDLERGPLLRAVLLRLRGDLHRFSLILHHIVTDGWSMGVLVRELGAVYGALTGGRFPGLPPLPVQYADFAVWQRRVLAAEKRGELEFWLARLGDEVRPLELPTDRPRPAVQTFQGRHHPLVLPAGLAARLQTFGRREGATLFMTLLAVAQELLRRQSGQDDLLVGTPVAGRRRLETERLIGFFLNTLVLRTDLSGAPGLRALVGRVREVTLDAFAHQDVPFEAVLAGLKGERDLSRTPLFQVLFNLLNLPGGEVRLPELTLTPLGGPEEVPSKFDLTFYVTEREAGIEVDLVYNAHLFDEARMADLAEQYAGLLAQAVAQPDAPLAALSLVTERARAVLPDPRAELGTAWVGAVHDLFTGQARRAPERTAVSDRHAIWTYGELDEASGRLAAWLLERGVGPEDRVVVWAHRSAVLVPAVLAALKAGAAFTLLDPAYPPARLVGMLALAAPRACLLVDAAGPLPAEVAAWLDAAECPRLVLPDGGPGAVLGLAGLPARPRSVAVGPDDLAYVAFTSGSTGTPKGILGRHGPLTHFLPWMRGRFGLSGEDRFTLLSGLAHDPLQRDVFTPLCLGAAIVVPDPDDIPVPGRIAAWMARAGATVAHLTPAMAQLITEPAGQARPAGPGVGVIEAAIVPSLRLALLVGEALTRQDVARLRCLAPAVTCVNLFGSTETQRAVGYHLATAEEATGGGRGHQVLALGRGMEDVQLLVLNPAGRLAGVGEVGEIAVRSPHLARGYLDAPGLTAARFRPNPAALAPAAAPAGDRLYRTGDLGRYLPDGEVVFAGRGDSQVKVRGFRVEPAEIEAALARHPAVAAAAALLHEAPDARGERLLVALVVPRPGAEPAPADLREHLLRELPSYMVPAAFARAATLPLTPNGKLNRRALPRLVPPLAELLGAASPADAAPRDPTEELLAGLWAGLLGLERVGIHDNFFSLGGHSLLATRLVARIREAFGVELPVRALFDAPTVAGLAELLAAGGGEAPAPPLRPAPRPGHGELPLSFAQERMWLLDRLAPGGSAYNIGAAVRLRGPLDAAAFGAALGEVVRRHEALRTAFREGVGDGPVQVVEPWRPRHPPALPVVDLSALSADGRYREREAEVRRLARAEAGRPFVLAAGRPLRATLLRLAPAGEAAEHVLLLTVHHIAADGWSIDVLVGELGALYGACRAGRPLSSVLPELPVQYADFALWQRAWLSGSVLDAQMAYWRQALAGAPNLELPTDRPRPAVRSPRGARRGAVLPPNLAEDLRRLARAQGATPFMVLLAAFDVLLARLSGQDDVLVGTPIANRTQRAVEGLIGFFANTLVLRGDLSGDPGFLALLGRIRETTLAAYAHQDLPFEKLVSELAPARDISRTPLFQVMFVLQNTHAGEAAGRDGFGGLAAERLEAGGETSKFDLTLALGEIAGGGYAGTLEHSTDLFDGATMERLLGQFSTLLAGLAADPGAHLSELPLLSPPERQALLEWNASAAALPGGDSCLHELVAEQVARTPDAVAVSFGGEALSYAELAARSGRLARRLRRLGAGPEVAVGVCLERSLELIVALLGVLEAGGAYLPLDPSYPRERLAFMLEDGRPPVVLAAADTAALLPPHAGRTVRLDGPLPAEDLPRDEPAAARATPENLAYVIFTSGSTGRPKGVMVRHRSIVNRVLWTLDEFPIFPGDRLLQKTPFSFDASIWEIFAPLWRGACLVVAPLGGHQDTVYMAAALARESITVLQAVPSLLRVLLDEPALAAATSLRRVFCGGEALAGDLVARCHELLPAAVTNLYGPTEVAIDATFWRCERGATSAAVLPIGRPIANDRVDLVDADGRIAPVGVAGELRVGGVGLARGYVGRPDLTAERFVPDPAAGCGPGSRLYRTGDLARRLPGGEIEYLGRIDHQVKIRGFRIELGEIEAALAADPGVLESVVVARPAGGAGGLQLVAYVVPRGEGLSLPGLRAGLTGRLPYYMLPAAFVVLPALPRTPNGKLDRRALPSPEASAAGREAGYEAPHAGAEERLAAVWAEVLGDRAGARLGGRVGRHDNFFALGGDSLLAIRIVNRAREAGLVLTPLQLFERQTVAELAALPQILADPAAAESPAVLPEPPADGGPDTSGADFDPDDLARFLANLAGG